MSTKLCLLMSLIGNCLVIIRAEKCDSFSDAISCKKGGCEYNLALGACQSPVINCEGKLGLTGCRRANAFYGDGGVISHYTGESDNGNCVEKEVILAVNMARTGGTDSRGIRYASGDDVKYDPNQTITRINAPTKCPGEEVAGIDDHDETIFISQFVGRAERWGGNRCVVFRGNVPNDGFYELNVKTAESRIDPDEQPNLKRVKSAFGIEYFNIQINKMAVVAELNIREYVSFCQGMELIFEFQVVGNVLTPSGFIEGVALGPGGGIEVGFCYGQAEQSDTYDPGYLVSAFNIVAMEGLDEGVKPSTCSNPGQVEKLRDCSKTDFISNCRRELSYYGVGGGICLNKETAPLCLVKGTPLGCHFDYFRYSRLPTKWDCRGVEYTRCSFVEQNLYGIPWVEFPWNEGFDGQGVAQIFDSQDSSSSLCKGKVFPESNADCKDGETTHLYLHPMIGTNENWSPGKCFEQHFEKDGDGVYEISVKTAEYEDLLSKTRMFHIKVNGMTAVRNLNLMDYVKPCIGMEILIELEIRGSLLTVSGFPPKELPSNNVITLGFCYGDRRPDSSHNPNFAVASFYIAKIQD